MMRLSLLISLLAGLILPTLTLANYNIEALGNPEEQIRHVQTTEGGNIVWATTQSINFWNGKSTTTLPINRSSYNSYIAARLRAANDKQQYITSTYDSSVLVDGAYQNVVKLYLHSAQGTETLSTVVGKIAYFFDININSHGDVIWVEATRERIDLRYYFTYTLKTKNETGVHVIASYAGFDMGFVGPLQWNMLGQAIWAIYDGSSRTRQVYIWDTNTVTPIPLAVPFRLTEQGKIYAPSIGGNRTIAKYDIATGSMEYTNLGINFFTFGYDGSMIGIDFEIPSPQLVYFDGTNSQYITDESGGTFPAFTPLVNKNNQFLVGYELEQEHRIEGAIVDKNGITIIPPYNTAEYWPYAFEWASFNDRGEVAWINWASYPQSIELFDGANTLRLASSEAILYEYNVQLSNKGFVVWQEYTEIYNEYGHTIPSTMLKVAYKEIPNNAPVADAGPDQQTYTGNVFQLNGSNSYDIDGDMLNYSWSIVFAPFGSNAQLLNVDSATPNFTPDIEGTYTLILVVNDGTEDSVADEVVITVITPAAYATNTTTETIAVINDPTMIDPTTDLNNENNATALSNKLDAVIADIEAGETALALDKLQNDLLPKTDGCALRGSPDISGKGGITKDWVTDCDAQATLYPLILSIIETLQ